MADRDLVIPLEIHSKPDVRQVGGKASGLIRLKQLGLAIPRGFCITTAAYQEHLDRCSIRRKMTDCLEAGKVKISMVLAEIQKSIIANPIDDSLLVAIRSFCDRLKGQPVAVRSSATLEDLEAHSFAGQYETYLGLDNARAIGDAVKKCWASMWGVRAFRYRQDNNLGHVQHGMAVIVQEMIAGTSSGVAFTFDPATGSKSNVVIESGWGLGEALVSGRIEPDRIYIDRRTMKHRKSIVGTKKIKVMKSGESVTLTREESEKLSLDAKLACKLARIARKIENAFGKPMDIEWTVKDRAIYILQARPITTPVRLPAIEDRQIWTDANTGEVLPDVVTPLTWSVVSPVVMAIFNSALGIVGADLKENSVCGVICGRVYFNINMIAGLLRNIPGFKKMNITTIFGGAQGSMGEFANIGLAEEYVPVVRLQWSKVALVFPIRITKMFTILASNKWNFLNEFKKKIERFEGLHLESRSSQNLMDLWQQVITRMRESLRESGYSGMAMLFYPSVDRLCQKWLASRPGIMVNQLLAGIGGIESARSGLALCELARIARRNPQLKETMLRPGTWNSI